MNVQEILKDTSLFAYDFKPFLNELIELKNKIEHYIEQPINVVHDIVTENEQDHILIIFYVLPDVDFSIKISPLDIDPVFVTINTPKGKMEDYVDFETFMFAFMHEQTLEQMQEIALLIKEIEAEYLLKEEDNLDTLNEKLTMIEELNDEEIALIDNSELYVTSQG